MYFTVLSSDSGDGGLRLLTVHVLQERLTAKEAMAHAYFEPVRRNEVNDLQNNAAHQ